MSDLGNLQSFLIQFLKSEIGNISASKSLATCFGCFSESAVNFSRDLQKRTNTLTRHGSPMSPCILLFNLSLTIILFIFRSRIRSKNDSMRSQLQGLKNSTLPRKETPLIPSKKIVTLLRVAKAFLSVIHSHTPSKIQTKTKHSHSNC